MYDLPETDAKFVSKPWGWEKWIASGKEFPYVLKQICTHAPNQSSIHVHKTKTETNLVIKGHGLVYLSRSPIDVDKYLQGEYSDQEIAEIIDLMEPKSIGAGCVFHVFPGFVHRVVAVKDLQTVECSTSEVDDVIRLQDDTGRGHGRIDDEHKSKE